MKELLIMLLDFVGLAYWVEIATEHPRCVYYFGPFLSFEDAQSAKGGYVEDLQFEGAQNILVAVKRCKPADLTIFDEKEDLKLYRTIPSLSSQAF